jgi:hypothetical protein
LSSSAILDVVSQDIVLSGLAIYKEQGLWKRWKAEERFPEHFRFTGCHLKIMQGGFFLMKKPLGFLISRKSRIENARPFPQPRLLLRALILETFDVCERGQETSGGRSPGSLGGLYRHD